MVVAEVSIDETGMLRSCSIEGHAGAGPRGGDIVCAAVSVLARTALKTLAGMDGIRISAAVPERGILGFEIEMAPTNGAAAVGVTDFLLEGLRSVALEYPDYCIVRERTERRKDNGN